MGISYEANMAATLKQLVCSKHCWFERGVERAWVDHAEVALAHMFVCICEHGLQRQVKAWGDHIEVALAYQ